jgi:hypothetical protein
MFQAGSRKIRWVRPRQRPLQDYANVEMLSSTRYLASVEEAPVELRSSFLDSLHSDGLPQADPTPEQDLQILLGAAAEIEHGLLAQYLYATYSCTDRAIASIVARIATEEMAHLVSVQNLLLASGTAPYLGRYDKSPQEFDPFPFCLEPVSQQVLAKYAACEMPDDKEVPTELRDVMPQLLQDATTSAGNMRPHRVGLLYAKIYWLFRDSDEPLADPSLEPWPGYPVELVRQIAPGHHVATYPTRDISGIQVDPGVWQATNRNLIVTKIAARADALNCIAQIAGQGEGFGNVPQSHFERFVAVYRTATSSGTISLPLLRDPWYQQYGRRGASESQITSPIAGDFSMVGDLLYEILLLMIGLSLHPDSGYDLPKRTTIAGAGIDMMRNCIKALVPDLYNVPARTGSEMPTIGLCFNMPSADLNPTEARARLATCTADVVHRARMLQENQNLDPGLQMAAQAVGDYIEQHSNQFS